MSSLYLYISAVSAAATVGTLFVWLYYARLLQLGFSRHEALLILILQTRLESSEYSACLLANLSREPLHVALILAIAHTDRGTYKIRITDYRELSASEEGEFAGETRLKEGPLGSGAYISLGSFRGILKTIARKTQLDREVRFREVGFPTALELAQHISELELRVIVHYSVYIRPAAARRAYTVHVDGEHIHFLPKQVLTEQFVTRRGRRKAEYWLMQDLSEEYAECGIDGDFV